MANYIVQREREREREREKERERGRERYSVFFPYTCTKRDKPISIIIIFKKIKNKNI